MSFSRSFSAIERSLALRRTQGPDTCPPVCGIDASPAAILHEWSDERSLLPCPDKRPLVISRQRSAHGLSGVTCRCSNCSGLPLFESSLFVEFPRMRSAKMALSGGEGSPLAAHDRKLIRRGKLSRSGSTAWAMVQRFIYGRMQMAWAAIREWRQKRALRAMLKDPRSARGFRSTGQLQKGIGADRSTTERLLLMLWTAPPLGT
jgi:hypothetical protein